MIESKYTIEYINPEDTVKTPSKSRQKKYGFALGGLALAALAYFLITLPAKKTTHQPKVVLSQQQPIKEVTNKDNNLAASAQPLKEKATNKLTPTKPVIASNNKTSMVNTHDDSLTPDIKSFEKINEENNEKANEKVKTTQTTPESESLEKLKAQLLETQNRNKELATELDAQIMENMELAALLEDSLYKINKEDKSYIKELKKLEQNTVTVTKTKKKLSNKALAVKTAVMLEPTAEIKQAEVKKVEVNTPKIRNTKPAITVSQATKKASAQKTNRVDLSTASQVDAIIANINDTSKTQKQTKLNNQQRGRGGIEASKVKLQTDINDMINSSKKDQSDELQKSLKDI